jgi:predicted phosphate transport protein (TIGR00153 family)
MRNRFYDRFLPKEPKFFPLLKKVADIMIVVAEMIEECIRSKDHAKAMEYFRKIKAQERKADGVANDIFDALHTTFITPFDREDINSLANRMDDVIDNITSSAKRIALYSPKRIPEKAVDLALHLQDSARFILKAVVELEDVRKNTDSIKSYCTELHSIENKADDIYENFLVDLFEQEKDGIEVMKMKEIMNELEKATDTAEHVGKIIKTILVKYV